MGLRIERMFTLPTVYDEVLTALSTRQTVLASNIANVNTPGFKRGDVDFAAAFDEAMRRVNEQDGAAIDSRPNRPRVIRDQSTSMRNDGNNVDVEREMAFLAETTIRYNTLVEYLSRRLRMLQTAVTDGRR